MPIHERRVLQNYIYRVTEAFTIKEQVTKDKVLGLLSEHLPIELMNVETEDVIRSKLLEYQTELQIMTPIESEIKNNGIWSTDSSDELYWCRDLCILLLGSNRATSLSYKSWKSNRRIFILHMAEARIDYDVYI